jgi:hypothetical protein
VVTTGKDVPIYLKQVTGLLESFKELVVFIQNDHVAKPKLQLDFHNSRSKGLGGGMLNGFHGHKARHPATRDNVSLVPIKASMIARFIRIHKENTKWSLNKKMVDKFRRSAMTLGWRVHNPDKLDTSS